MTRDAVKKRHPGREDVADTLFDLIGDAMQPLQPSPTAIHVHDANSPSATYRLVRDAVRSSSTSEGLGTTAAPSSSTVPADALVSTAFIDPLLTPSPKLLFTAILSSFGLESRSLADDSIDSFIDAIQTHFRGQSSRKGIIVVQRAERMRDIWPEHVWEPLFSLAEQALIPGQLTLITVSSLSMDHFRTSRGAAPVTGPGTPISMTLGRLKKQDVLRILERDFDRLWLDFRKRRDDVDERSMKRVYDTFTSIAYDAFASDVRDIDEIRLLSACVWHPFIEPVASGAVAASAIQPLVSQSSHLFRDALARLFPRIFPPLEWVQKMLRQQQGLAIREKSRTSEASLALVPSFIVLASFLASFNPSRLDVRYFLRDEASLLPSAIGPDGEEEKVRKRGGALKRKPTSRKRARIDGAIGADAAAKQDLKRQQLLGPRPFPQERLLAIFQALITEAGPEQTTTSARAQDMTRYWEHQAKAVSTYRAIEALCREGRFLVRISPWERIDGGAPMSLRTNVGYEEVKQIADRVDFDLDEWLWDWGP